MGEEATYSKATYYLHVSVEVWCAAPTRITIIQLSGVGNMLYTTGARIIPLGCLSVVDST